MATSVVEVCNLALTVLGQPSIASITEATEGARKCNIIFADARDTVLRSNTWNFATTVEELVKIADEEILGWEYLYTLPSLCLYARRVDTLATLNGQTREEFEILLSPTTNVKALATNLEDAYLRYTKRIVDPALWGSIFTTALSLYLASELALSLTGDKELSTSIYNTYMRAMAEATRINAFENKEDAIEKIEFIDAR